MQSIVSLYSELPGEISKFLEHFYKTSGFDNNKDYNADWKKETDLHWQKSYPNPIEAVDIIGTYIENIDSYNLAMWISIDSGVFIKVTEDNADELIRYLYERYPY